MKNKIILLFLLVFTISLVNAYYPGEKICVEHNLATDHIVYTIVDNVTSIVEPEVTFNSTHINITFPTSMPPQSYKIVFLEETTNEVVVEVPVYHSSGGGGGGSKTKYVEKEVVKEVPNYITEYVNNDSTMNISCTTGGEEKFNFFKLFVIIAGIVILLTIFSIFTKRLFSSKDDNDIDERRYEEYE